MFRTGIIVSALFLFSLASCKRAEEVEFDANSCKRTPAFIQALGFDQRTAYFSTSDKKIMGLVLIQSPKPGDPAVAPAKVYQHPSWKMGGWLAPIMVDDKGNIFTSPAPLINVLNNPASGQNTIYKVDAASGVMEEFMRLPIADSTEQNAFGIIGMAYLCETNTLYVSSIAGSDRQHERGVIYAIDVNEKKIIDRLTATDAMGMGISYITGQRKLFFGNGRNSGVSSITLDKKGMFNGKPEFAFSLAGLGPRGDDKVRRINVDKAGDLTIIGMEFNFNLIAPAEKQEAYYKAEYFFDEKKWTVQ